MCYITSSGLQCMAIFLVVHGSACSLAHGSACSLAVEPRRHAVGIQEELLGGSSFRRLSLVNDAPTLVRL